MHLDTNLPFGWVKTNLERVTILMRNGLVIQQANEPVGVPISRIETISSGVINYERVKYVKKIAEDKKEKYLLCRGDILFSHINSDLHLGKTALYDSHEDLLHGMNLLLLRPNSDCIHPKYLNFFLNYCRLDGRFIAIAQHAVNQASLNQQKLRGFSVFLAPLEEQKRIVEKIELLFSHLDEAEALLKQTQQQIHAYRQAVLKAAITGELTKNWRAENKDKLESGRELLQRILEKRQRNWAGIGKYNEPFPPETNGITSLPKGWTYVTLGHLIDGIEAGKSFRCLERSPNDDEVGVAKVSALSWGDYDENESKTCKDSDKINEKYFIKVGDLLISRANTIDLVGASVLVRNVTKRIMLSDKTLRLRGVHYPSSYLLLVLRSTFIREQIRKLSTGNQASMRNISQESLLSLKIPIPCLEEAEIIEKQAFNLLERAEQLSEKIERQISMKRQLKKIILSYAFSGKLVKQDPNDEPASELLARIQEEITKTTSSTTPRRNRTSKKRATS